MNVNFGNNAPQTGWVLAYYRTNVKFGFYKDVCSLNDISFLKDENPEELLELHLFNTEKEYRAIKKSDGIFLETTIVDNDAGENSDMNYIDENMKIIGKEYESGDEEKTVVKQWGNKYTFYLPISKEDFKKGLFLKVRSYIGFDNDGLINIENYRLVDVFVKEAE